MEERETQHVALVTGASRGIGQAIALAIGNPQTRIICVSRSAASCEDTVRQLKSQGVDALAVGVDVADSQQIAKACGDFLRDFGVVDILINNAGINRDNLLMRMSDRDWNEVLQTDLSSCFHWTHHLCRPMMQKRWGRIVNITSVIGLIGNAGQANYAAAKAGVIGFTKSIAREFAGRNITANAIAPGFIASDMTAALPEKISQGILANIPMKRFGTPKDVAKVVRFLISDAADYMTGQVLTVDGGMVMQ